MTIALPAVLTIAEARAEAERLVAALAEEDQPVVDASGLQSLDTSAIAVLLECRRAAQAAGKTLQVLHAPPKLGQLAKLYGVDGLIA
jgi:phospholipid transport system transporter-binding protein